MRVRDDGLFQLFSVHWGSVRCHSVIELVSASRCSHFFKTVQSQLLPTGLRGTKEFHFTPKGISFLQGLDFLTPKSVRLLCQ